MRDERQTWGIRARKRETCQIPHTSTKPALLLALRARYPPSAYPRFSLSWRAGVSKITTPTRTHTHAPRGSASFGEVHPCEETKRKTFFVQKNKNLSFAQKASFFFRRDSERLEG